MVIWVLFDLLVGYFLWQITPDAEGWLVVLKFLAVLVGVIIVEIITRLIFGATFGKNGNGISARYRGSSKGGNWYKDYWG